jgi:predicted AAA+ superfamily ATPase
LECKYLPEVVYHLYPFTSLELGEKFVLEDVLRWGTLPKIYSLESDREKKAFLNSYIQTYFSEEIRAEQILRKLEPFRAFLPILGQVSGKVINHKKIADEIGVSSITVQNYFQVIEDTLLGFYLPAFHQSVRKSQKSNPKFYLFDTGVKKALEQSLDQVVVPRTSVFGELFESFLINEIMRLNSYF